MSENWDETQEDYEIEDGYDSEPEVAEDGAHPEEPQIPDQSHIPGRSTPEIKPASRFMPGTSRTEDPRAQQDTKKPEDPKTDKNDSGDKSNNQKEKNNTPQNSENNKPGEKKNADKKDDSSKSGKSSVKDDKDKIGKESREGDSKSEGGKDKPNSGGGLKDKAQGLAKSAASKAMPDGVSEKATKAVETAQKVQAAAQAVVHSIQSAVAVLSNPVSWIVMAAAVIITVLALAVSSSMMVIGRNENADGCFGIGGESQNGRGLFGTGSFIQGAVDKADQEGADWTNRGNQAGSWLMSQKWEFLGGKGMSREQAAGILGNFIQESGLKYARAEMKGPNSNGSMDHMSNEEADAFTKNYAPAGLGLAQWTWNPGRAKTLLDLAKSMGKNWYDAEVQLTMIKNEVDSSYGQRLLAAGFNDQGKSEKDLALIFHDVFEGSADNAQGLAERQDSATEFLSKFKGSSGGVSSDGGGSCTRGKSVAGGGGKDNIVQFAISIAYPTKEESRCPEPRGYSCAPQAYKDAKHKMEQATGADPLDLWADCGRFAATVVKNTVDPEFPWGPTGEQYKYASSSPKWQAYEDYNQRQPGDIFITKPEYVGHIFVYLGQIDGKDKIAEASMEERVGGVGEFYLNSSLAEDYTVGGANRHYTGFHYVGG